ncbi:helix-turn-helix domain-containing protein (plasmid) [Streptomyces sp. BI20]|uniref:helix-turn-helix domain-containing protein n=1 Tax=Streptomyces sp. BI20 TaxID=3403460 RepID=UPI003C762126
MSSTEERPDLPPLAPARAAARRAALGLTTGQVAWALGAYLGRPVHPDAVAAWESGAHTPDTPTVRALAAALWCEPADLVGDATTLAQCRAVAGLGTGEVAALVGLTRAQWERVEAHDRWQGDAARSAALLRALRPPPACWVAVCGKTGHLRVVLREAVTGWWPPHVPAVAAIVPMAPEVISTALERLHLAYQRLDQQAGASPEAAALAEQRSTTFLDHVDGYLWEALRLPPPA